MEMLRLFGVAARNLFRHKSRTLFTFIAISVGIAIYIVIDSLMSGADRLAIKNLIDLETGHYRIHAPGYYEDRESFPLDKSIENPEEIIRRLENLPGVLGISPRVQFMASFNNGREESPVVGIGVDPEKEGAVFATFQYISRGQPLKGGEHKALIGRKLAELMEVDVGDYAIIITRTRTNTFQAIDVEIAGLLDSPHPGMNQNFVYLPLDVVQKALSIDGNATEIDIRFPDQEAVPRMERAIEERLRGIPFEGVGWRELASDFLGISQVKRAGGAVIMLMVLVIAAVGIVNTLLLSTIERTREIGTMKAMGMYEREITALFLIESGGIGLLGSIGGCILGGLANLYFVRVGFNIASMVGDIDVGYPIEDVFYGSWNWGSFVFAFVFGIIVCLIVGFLPSRRAARMDPVEALRHV
ncbi:MAG: ABC transporter permease [bacterium]